MRIIPKNTRIRKVIYKSLTLSDVVVGFCIFAIGALLFLSNIPYNWLFTIVFYSIGVALFFNSGNGRMYMEIVYQFKFLTSKRQYEGEELKQIMPYTGIKDGLIHYGGDYYGAVIELSPTEFRLLSEYKQDGIINTLANAIKLLSEGQKCSLVKIDRPLLFDEFSQYTLSQVRDLEGLNSDTAEINASSRVLRERLNVIDNLNNLQKLYKPCFYMVIYDADQNNCKATAQQILHSLIECNLEPELCDDKGIAVFLKYCHSRYFDEREIENLEPEKYFDWAIPKKVVFERTGTKIDNIKNFSMTVADYPLIVSNAWGAKLFDIDHTRVVLNFSPVDKDKSTKRIDKACVEILSGADEVRKLSKINETQVQLETLQLLTSQLGNDNEVLFDCTMHITTFDNEQAGAIKKTVRKLVRQDGFRVSELFGRQFDGFVSSNISMRDNLKTFARGIPSSTLSAIFPFVSNVIMEGYSETTKSIGIPIGYNGYPVFLDFFKRDTKHTNSNMMMIGKSGGGKSYATKHLLANFVADGCRVFILDPENEYGMLAKNMGGRLIDVGQATEGRLNPFHMTVSLRDELNSTVETDEESSGADCSASYFAYLQFLESFFRSIFEQLTPDAFEYLNKLIVEMYTQKGITANTDIASLAPSDFPIFDDLYSLITTKLKVEKLPSIKAILTNLEMYVSKFSTGGRNSALWNGYSSISFDEQIVVFNFQSLLSNKNNSIANAQMLLVLKILDNEIIKNMDYNRAMGASRRIVITVDEAHTFIDPKYPIALDFMKETAKRIRKYNGMLQVITQNIKDFTGSPLIASKASAVINACQYSMIFGLNPTDMHDLVELYSKSCPINDIEAEDIAGALRGVAFLITSPQNRSSIQIAATDAVVELFS